MIVLFKEGTSHVYNGITCQYLLVDEFSYEPFLKQGWKLNVKDLYKDEGETPKEDKKEKDPKKPKEKEEETATSKVTARLKALDGGPKAIRPSMTSTNVAVSAKK